MTNPSETEMTAEERAQIFVDAFEGFVVSGRLINSQGTEAHDTLLIMAAGVIRDAETQGFRAGLEAAAKVADGYASRMRHSSTKRSLEGRPTQVAECKLDAAESIAGDIRSLAEKKD